MLACLEPQFESIALRNSETRSGTDRFNDRPGPTNYLIGSASVVNRTIMSPVVTPETDGVKDVSAMTVASSATAPVNSPHHRSSHNDLVKKGLMENRC